MLKTILRKEHKNEWERRAALTPLAIKQLKDKNFSVDVESSVKRIYSDNQYQACEAKIVKDPAEYDLVIGIKEPPVESIQKNQVHLAFSHTIKGQDYNMPLLQRFLDQKATLLDYEVMVDANGKRTIAFGIYAGIAGAIDTLWLTGKKLNLKGHSSGLEALKQTVEYGSIDDIKTAFSSIDLQAGHPVQIVIVGSGNVGQGAEQVCQWLSLPKLDKKSFLEGEQPTDSSWYTVLSSPDLHRPIDGGEFDYPEYLEKGKETYESCFHEHLGKFNVLLQTPYWTDFYPKHLPLEVMKTKASDLPLAVGDISCDIDGSLACTKRITSIDDPCFSYLAESDEVIDGLNAEGVTVMAIDNLPCELSMNASEHFSSILADYMPELMSMDLSQGYDELQLNSELKGATIVYRGELTPHFKYLEEFL